MKVFFLFFFPIGNRETHLCLVWTFCVWVVCAQPECERCGLLRELPICTLSASAGTICKIHVDSIRPTQFSIGPLEVTAETTFGQKYLGEDRFQDFLTMFYIPITIGLENFYLTDKHHHVASIKRSPKVANSDKWITAFINENRADDSEDEFWRYMVESNLVWLYGPKGEGPLDPAFLPQSINTMRSDPFRDLAYVIKKREGFIDTEANFQEFAWANYFRRHIAYPHKDPLPLELETWCTRISPYDDVCAAEGFVRSDWINSEVIRERAMYLSAHVYAKHLPGFKTVKYLDRLETLY